MSKKIILVLAAAYMCLLVGCHKPPSIPNALPPSVMIDDVLYYYTGDEASLEIDEDLVMGTVTSTVSLSEMPSEDGQSNMTALMGCPYAPYEEDLVVLVKAKWLIFEMRNTE